MMLRMQQENENTITADKPQAPILIIDTLNLFHRSYVAYPSMNSNGEQTGGIVGFLKTLYRLMNEIQPRQVYVVWESGGSSKRRALFKEYKLGRRPEKLNRFYEDDIPETPENRMHQIVTLLSVLKDVPVCQIYVEDCEADDVIGYLSRYKFKDESKVIASSDKDFYQLLNENTISYSFHKKDFVTASDVLECFRVTASNFALAKALCGDSSDNIPGVKGLGFKTVAKRFPFLGTDSDVLLDDVFKFCHTHLDEATIYKRVLGAESEIRRNWKLVYLDTSSFSAHQISKVDSIVDTYQPKVNKIGMIKKLMKESIFDFDVSMFLYAFNCIENFKII